MKLKELTYLYDWGTKGDKIVVYPPILAQKAIIATSPDRTHTQSFWKDTQEAQVKAVRLCMPLWSLDELKYLAEQEKYQKKR